MGAVQTLLVLLRVRAVADGFDAIHAIQNLRID
jgi:hypothetical protein